jgi:hypothetical protein
VLEINLSFAVLVTRAIKLSIINEIITILSLIIFINNVLLSTTAEPAR